MQTLALSKSSYILIDSMWENANFQPYVEIMVTHKGISKEVLVTPCLVGTSIIRRCIMWMKEFYSIAALCLPFSSKGLKHIKRGKVGGKQGGSLDDFLSAKWSIQV